MNVLLDALDAACRIDAGLTALIGTPEYPDGLTGLHTELRLSLLMLPSPITEEALRALLGETADA